MDADNKDLVSVQEIRIRWPHLLVFPLAWITGILSLQVFGTILPDFCAFISSCCGALLGVVILWFFFLRHLDRSISLPLILVVFFLKATVLYYVWTANVFAPLDGGGLEVAHLSYFHEASYFWKQVGRIVQYWNANGFTIFLPFRYVNYEHPEAMCLAAMPFTALPTYSEVLIPWNMFYTTAAGAAIYAIGRLEGFSQRVCKLAFYLVLIQPFGWYVWEPLKRDAQGQMCFGFFILAVLMFHKRSVILMLVSIVGCFVLSFYRLIYGPIFICAAIYAFIYGGGRIGLKAIKRISLIGIFVVVTLCFSPKQYTDNIVNKVKNLIVFYGVGNAQVVSKIGYQERLTRHNSWMGSIPDRLALGLVSPFPWTNILTSKNSFEWSATLTDCLHTALMLVCFASVAVFGLRDFNKIKYPPSSVVFALGIATSGFFGYAVHNVYVQIGMLCTFPYVLDKLGKKKLFDCFLVSICLFVISSVLWDFMK